MDSDDGRRRRSAASRASILDAAELLFGESGFHSTSVRSIAASIGMSHAGVLKHFPGKEDLLVAILERLGQANLEFGAAQPPGLTARESLRRRTEFTLSRPAGVQLSTILLGEATDAEHPAHAHVRDLLGTVESRLDLDFPGRGVEILAAWNGLQVLWLYLPDRVDAVAILQSMIRREDSEPGPPGRVTAQRRSHSPAPTTRQEQIVSAAGDAFARGGYRSTGLREIAADLGLSHGAVLYHFPSKTELLTAVLGARDQDDSLPWAWDETPLDYLNGMYLQALHNEQHPGLTRLFATLVTEATDATHPAHDFFEARYLAFHSELRDALTAEARAGIDPDATAWELIAFWEGLGLRSFYRADRMPLAERLRSHLNTVLKVTLNHTSVTTG